MRIIRTFSVVTRMLINNYEWFLWCVFMTFLYSVCQSLYLSVSIFIYLLCISYQSYTKNNAKKFRLFLHNLRTKVFINRTEYRNSNKLWCTGKRAYTDGRVLQSVWFNGDGAKQQQRKVTRDVRFIVRCATNCDSA